MTAPLVMMRVPRAERSTNDAPDGSKPTSSSGGKRAHDAATASSSTGQHICHIRRNYYRAD
jgi:hypothetical protein